MRRHRVREHFQRRKLAKMNTYGNPAVEQEIDYDYGTVPDYGTTTVVPQEQMAMVPGGGGFFMKVKNYGLLTTLTTWTLLHGVVAVYHLVKTGRYFIRRRNLKLQMLGLAAQGIDPNLAQEQYYQ